MLSWSRRPIVALLLLTSSLHPCQGYNNALGRRRILSGIVSIPFFVAQQAPAAESESPLTYLQESRDTLQVLLDNWEKATVDCTFADVPRELLETKNKELLLEKASTFALFDKSVSVESCKTTNRVVRDYLGATGKGPLVGIDKKIPKAIDLIDPDRLDDFVAGM